VALSYRLSELAISKVSYRAILAVTMRNGNVILAVF
jgi:hypothetical protein